MAEGCPSIPPWPAVGASPQYKDPDVTVWKGSSPPAPRPWSRPGAPRPRPASLTQLAEELHPQGSVDEEEQHEEEAQVAHLRRQRWGRVGPGVGREAARPG